MVRFASLDIFVWKKSKRIDLSDSCGNEIRCNLIFYRDCSNIDENRNISKLNGNTIFFSSIQTTAVLFTSTQCGFCKIFSSALLTVSNILKDANFLKFGVIDVDQNDLKWHLTMTTVPTLIVFHGNK